MLFLLRLLSSFCIVILFITNIHSSDQDSIKYLVKSFLIQKFYQEKVSYRKCTINYFEKDSNLYNSQSNNELSIKEAISDECLYTKEEFYLNSRKERNELRQKPNQDKYFMHPENKNYIYSSDQDSTRSLIESFLIQKLYQEKISYRECSINYFEKDSNLYNSQSNNELSIKEALSDECLYTKEEFYLNSRKERDELRQKSSQDKYFMYPENKSDKSVSWPLIKGE